MTDIPRHVSHAPPPPPPPARPAYHADHAFYWPGGMSQWSPGETWPDGETLPFLVGTPNAKKPQSSRRSLARRIGLRHPEEAA